MKKYSVTNICDCFGCGLCASVCPKRAINLNLNDDGFYNPYVDSTLCVECGICIDICSFSHNGLSRPLTPLYSYGAWSNDSELRQKCSSGGVAYELSRYLLNNGYKVCAVRYNIHDERAEHYIASTEEELQCSAGSKYIQSYTVEAFRQINRNDKYLITGTPCQIDSFRRYIRKFRIEDNFILMDFFCHSVPSLLAWRKYLKITEKRTGKLENVSWRNKLTGWHDSWLMHLEGNKGSVKSWFSKGDLFYKLFLGDYCCNPACIKNCKFKYDRSSADIRIGDFWGNTYKNDESGVSSVVAFTEQGDELIKSLDCVVVEYPFKIVAEGQMKKNAGKAYTSSFIMRALKDQNTDEDTFRFICKVEGILRLPHRLLNKLSRALCRRK